VKHDDKRADLERFRTLVESYGADPARWPDAEKRTFEELASSEEARVWLAEQRRLDDWLDGAEGIAPSPALLRRVAEIPVRHAAHASWVWPFGRLRSLIAAAAAVATVGMVVGITIPDFASDDGADDWDELSTLALGADFAEEP
jgi:hypothetical protein